MINNCKFFPVLCLVLSAVLSSCSNHSKNGQAEVKEEGVATVLPQEKSEVTVMRLNKQMFNHELVSNGKISACNLADMRFETSEVVAHIFVKNGDHVRKGQRLAELDKFRLSNRLAQSKESLERAKIELKDVLIGQGYMADSFDKVPSETMKLAKVKSGYEQSRVQYEMAKRELDKSTLVAPFDGVVANLFTKPYNLSNTAEAFCAIVDTKGMEADFSVLESELILIKKGDRVEVMPFIDRKQKFIGQITEINPLVDRNGMVRVKARVDGRGNLFSGMNVRVSILRAVNKCLVIPKTAVVVRSGRSVVFTLERGRAKWNYVQVGLENAMDCIVSERTSNGAIDGLVEGDSVIVSGNLNLAHDTPVVLSK